MSRLVSRAESWKRVYTAFANINFAAFDYNSVKQSILDYIKLYFPETFNDFIESSELIAIVEAFSYIAEILAYRMDVTAHENFITTAQRRDSILKLAKLISYKASRPLPARGLVKITSVSTTETLIDSNGINLAGRVIRWNDTTNALWKDQFVLVMNRVLDQEFGSVVATDRFQMQDVLFEIYPLVTTKGVMPYNASVYGQSINMELVPVAKQTGDAFSGATSGITERRPQNNAQFTVMYGSDGLGDASETTGFFCFTKQGTLQKFTTTFDGITPNATYDVPVTNVNDTDVWVNNIDPDTGDIIVRTTNLPYKKETLAGKYGEWVEVDIAHAQNVIFNTNPKRNKFEVETVGENKVRLLFGDGEFADIPQGAFDVWVRTSINDDVVVPQSSVVDIPISFTYTDLYNQAQTFTFTITLIGSLQNASAAETTEHVRQTAPAVYYTQDRMVNNEDYNVYLRQNPTVLKLRAVNRTFAGDSKYITWHDSSNTYENVKIFGDDGLFYIADVGTTQTTPSVETNVLISTYIEPLLVSTDVFMQLTTAGVDHTKIRRVFNAEEKARLTAALTPPPTLRSADLYFNTFSTEWHAVKTNAVVANELVFEGFQTVNLNGYVTSLERPLVYKSSSSAPYAADFVINGNQIASLIVGTQTKPTPTTFGELISYINEVLATYNCQAVIQNGNIVVKAAKNVDDPSASSIYIEENVNEGMSNLFSDIIISLSDNVVLETPYVGYAYPTNFIKQPLIKVRQVTEQESKYNVSRAARRIVLESQTTSFWNTNTADRVMDYDTLRSSFDVINILQANPNCNRDGILQRNWSYIILGQEIVESGPDVGMADIHRVSIISIDENNDNVPDNLNFEDDVTYMGVADIVKPKMHYTIDQDTLIKLPVMYIIGFDDIEVTATRQDGTSVVVQKPTFIIPTSSSTVTPDEFGGQIIPDSLGWVETSIIDLDADVDTLVSTTYGGYGIAGKAIKLINVNEPLNVTVRVNEHVYFYRQSLNEEWLPVECNSENIQAFVNDYAAYNFKVQKLNNTETQSDVGDVFVADEAISTQYELKRQWKRYLGRDNINFSWMHFSPRYQLVDPSPTNIIDIFVITRGYFTDLKRWLVDPLAQKPLDVTPLSLRNDYGKLLDNKMASDTVILHPGKIKLLFGDKAAPALQAKFKVIRSVNSTMTDNQIKNTIVATTRNFFDIAGFEFGETFFFTELATAIHMDLTTEISSVVLVPTLQNSQFGDLLQVFAREDEILYPDIDVEDIDIVTGFTPTNLRLNG